MKRLYRAAGFLVLMIAVFTILPKMLPAKVSLELQPYGFYAGRNNSDEWKALPVQYVDPNLCNACHSNKSSSWSAGAHKDVSCENCHGPGKAHVDSKAKMVISNARDLCAQCHAAITGRPASFPQVNLQEHGAQAPCVMCHNPHSPSLGASQFK